MTHRIEQATSLHYGDARKALVTVVPDSDWPGLYRVAWPDIGLSLPVNLTRAKDAARQWAERKTVTDIRKKRGVGALKSLDNFSWSSRRITQNGRRAA